MKKTRLISLLLTIVMFLSLVNCQNTPQNNIQELGSKKDFKVNTLYYDDDGDVTEPIEEACAEGYTGACELQKLLEDKKQAKNNPNDPNKPKTKPTPKPKPSPSDECKDSKSISPSQLQLAPTGFSTMSFHTKNFTADTITDNINYLIEKTEMAKVYKIKYDGFFADKTTDSTKLSELKKQLDDEIAERDLITQQILQGLNDYKGALRNQVNTLMGDPNYSVDDTVKPIDLQGYKDTIYLLNDDFLVYVDSENTYGLIDSLNVLANENKLLIDLINDFTTNTLLDLPTTSNTNNLSTIDKLTKPEQVIRYFSNQIKLNREKFNIQFSKIDFQVKKTQTEVEKAKADFINSFQKYENAAKEILPILQELDQISNDSNYFTIQSFGIKGDCGGTHCYSTPKFQKERELTQQQQSKNNEQMHQEYPGITTAVESIIPTPVGSEGMIAGKTLELLGKYAGPVLTGLLERLVIKKGPQLVTAFDNGILIMAKESKNTKKAADNIIKSEGKFKNSCESWKKCSKNVLNESEKIANKNFYDSISKLPAGERVAIVKTKAKEFANKKGWAKNSVLESKNPNRTIYEDTNSKTLYSVDTQHGHFEVLTDKGKQQGSIDFWEQPTKPADLSGKHNLRIK